MKENPRFFKSLLMASEAGVLAGTCFDEHQAFTIGDPPVNCQM
jgi:hypothetical protein